MKRAPWIAVILLLAGAAAGCSGGADGAPKNSPAAAAAAPSPSRVLRVATTPAAIKDVTYTIEAVGSIEAREQVQVVAGVEGVVASVRFREGDAVTPSTVLATIDPERFRMLAERAKANLDKIDAQSRQAIADLKRREELLKQVPPLVSEEEVERARQEAERLRASVAEARSQFELADLDRRRSVVHPLVPGVINSKTVATGQHVEAQAVLATLVDTRALEVRFRISEQESVRLTDGVEVRFTTAGRPGKEFTARVFHVSSTADPTSRMVECLARVDNPAGVLKPGFFAEVKADVESHKGAVVIPERSVLSTDRGFVVFEVIDGKAVERRVSLGLRTRDGGVEIASGLEPSAQVVTDGGDILRDGATVQVVSAAPAGAAQ
ncbi:MAG TPA: efflux RND transporter periplasmic adaptor subunit [Candidatus Polarisedimenticolia bacterium]|jgi:membrane fusion protein (multidrug efflux system)/multidrug efflux system membrane fusion protein|nr:efflux RND transporter periplasmic adaptor subunit [Candidatus Polarisedimenticolia bacterium]